MLVPGKFREAASRELREEDEGERAAEVQQHGMHRRHIRHRHAPMNPAREKPGDFEHEDVHEPHRQFQPGRISDDQVAHAASGGFVVDDIKSSSFFLVSIDALCRFASIVASAWRLYIQPCL